MNKKLTSKEQILEEAKHNGFDYREVGLYAKMIIRMNDEIDPLYAYKLAYEEHHTRKKLRDFGYSEARSRNLAGNIRYGIY